MASDRNEQDEEEYVERSQWYKAERFHRHPYDHNDPNRRLLRLSDYKREGKATAVPVVKGMTFDVISEKHQQATKAWRELPDYHAWVAVIEQTLFKHQKLNVTSCMCLGLGTLTGTIRITGHPFREVSLAQLVVFESIVDLLSRDSNFSESIVETDRAQRPNSTSNTSIFRSMYFGTTDISFPTVFGVAKHFLGVLRVFWARETTYGWTLTQAKELTSTHQQTSLQHTRRRIPTIKRLRDTAHPRL